MNKQNIGIGLALVALVIAIGAYAFPQARNQAVDILGDAGTRFQRGISVGTNTAPTGNGLKVGDNGTEIREFKATTCAFTDADASHTATTTRIYGCAVTGVTSADLVWGNFATSSIVQNTVLRSWMIISAKASTTDGFVDFSVLNLTGGAAAISASNGLASSTNVFYIDN